MVFIEKHCSVAYEKMNSFLPLKTHSQDFDTVNIKTDVGFERRKQNKEGRERKQQSHRDD